jgi:hypothetical protein
VALEPEHDVVRPHDLQQRRLVVDLHALAADPMVKPDHHGPLGPDLLQVFRQPVERLARDVAPVLEQHGGVERDEVDVLVVPALVERPAGAAGVALLAARVPADVVVAGRGVDLHVGQALDGLLVLRVLLVGAVLADVAGADDEGGPGLSLAISSNIAALSLSFSPAPKWLSEAWMNVKSARAADAGSSASKARIVRRGSMCEA